MKKKKSSFVWRVAKAVFIGVGKGIRASFKFLFRKIKEENERLKVRKSPYYKISAKFDSLQILKQIKGDYSLAEKRLHGDSVIALIFGKRGSGKSSLGFRLLENIHSRTGRRCYTLGINQMLLPKWIASVDNAKNVPNGGVLLVDEGAITFGARDSMKAKNKELSNLMAIARHKGLTLIFVTQNTSMLDRNILKLSDILLIKEGSLLQLEMERPEIKKFYEKAAESFKKIKGNRKGFFYLIDSDFEGVLSYNLPSFWGDALSKNRA